MNTQYNLTVTDINGDDVISIQQLYVHFFFLCSSVTGWEDKSIFVVIIINMINVFT